MNEFQHWHREKWGENAVKALVSNNFSATYCPTRQEALAQILELIISGETIGVGGSQTIRELGLDAALEARGHTVLNHQKPGLSVEESMALRRRQLTCDVFLSSTNAITLDGELVNVDGAGNRVAAMIFGPKRTIIVAGVNKIVRDVRAAEERIKTVAAPINAKRLGRQNPCVQTGICMDCSAPGRICAVTSILRKRPYASDIKIFIVGEELGF